MIKYDVINQQIADMTARCKLTDWAAFTAPLDVPPEIVAALMTGRPELVRLGSARAFTAAQGQALLHIIATLLETNAALREHAQQVAHLVGNWANAFDTLRTVGVKIEHFANFRQLLVDDDDASPRAG